jgi:hypothetical protein
MPPFEPWSHEPFAHGWVFALRMSFRCVSVLSCTSRNRWCPSGRPVIFRPRAPVRAKDRTQEPGSAETPCRSLGFLAMGDAAAGRKLLGTRTVKARIALVSGLVLAVGETTPTALSAPEEGAASLLEEQMQLVRPFAGVHHVVQDGPAQLGGVQAGTWSSRLAMSRLTPSTPRRARRSAAQLESPTTVHVSRNRRDRRFEITPVLSYEVAALARAADDGRASGPEARELIAPLVLDRHCGSRRAVVPIVSLSTRARVPRRSSLISLTAPRDVCCTQPRAPATTRDS